MTKSFYFPQVQHLVDREESIRRLKRAQLEDQSLIVWGSSFIGDSGNGRRHQIKLISLISTRPQQI